jgi:hypothetical protein
MKQNKNKLIKKLFIEYRKIIIDSIIHAVITGLNFTLLIATYRISDIKAGQYPEQPISIREELLSEAMPGIIISSIAIFLLIMIVSFITLIMVKLRQKYNIYLIYEIKNYLKKNKKKRIS